MTGRALAFMPRLRKPLMSVEQRTMFSSIKQSNHSSPPTRPTHLSAFKKKLRVLSSANVVLGHFISIIRCAFPIVFYEIIMVTYMVFLSIHSCLSDDLQSRGFRELPWIRYVTYGELQTLRLVGGRKRNSPGVTGLQLCDTHRLGKRRISSLEVRRIITSNTALSTCYIVPTSFRKLLLPLSPLQGPAKPGTVTHILWISHC